MCVQAYLCLTDVQVKDLLQMSMRSVSQVMTDSQAYKYMLSQEDKTCHVQVWVGGSCEEYILSMQGGQGMPWHVQVGAVGRGRAPW